MNVLAIDASTKSTGIAIFQNKKLIKYNCIISTSTDLVKRIYYMTDKIKEIIQQNDIDTIVIQQVRPQDGPNLQTQKALMYLQANLHFMLHDNYPKLKMQFTYPNQWRKKCGIHTGRGVKRDALKKQDMKFVKQKFHLEVNDDIADAICIGYAYLIEQDSFFV